MSCTMRMLAPIKMRGPHARIPDGMKITCLEGPNTLTPAKACSVLSVGSFVLWPMSYIDNRVSFGMVMYNPKHHIVKTVEKKGARYIYKITLDGSGTSGSATFWGQADQHVTMTLDEICHMLT